MKNSKDALLVELRGIRSELRTMCGLLRTWETNGIPTERVDFPVDTSELFTAPVDRGPAWDRVVVNPISSDTSVIVESVNRTARQLATERRDENQALAEQIRSIREDNARSAAALSDWLARTAPAAKSDGRDGTDPSDPVESRLP